MSAKVWSVEDHNKGRFHVDLQLDGAGHQRLDSMVAATKYIEATKKSRGMGAVMVTLKEIVITAKRQLVYETCYAL